MNLYLLIASTCLCVILTIIISFFYTLDIVYTHLYYIPIVLAGIWYPPYAIRLAFLLGIIHIAFSYRAFHRFPMASFLRFLVLIMVAYSTSRVAYHKEQLFVEHEKLEEEMRRAREIHRQLLPEELPKIEGLSLAVYYTPARITGGDLYDVMRVKNKLIFYLSDVSGHGLDSSMLSFFIKHTVKGYLSFSESTYLTPRKILRYLAQQFIEEDYPEEFFICIFLGILDLETWELTYSGLGFQDTPLISWGDGSTSEITTKSLFISSCFPIDAICFKEKTMKLTPGTTIFFNTDGLTEEGEPGALYSDRLPRVFYKNAHLPPHELAQVIVDDFKVFNNGSYQGNDDITFLILQIE